MSLYLLCLQSVQKQSARRQAEQAVESGLFSLFSEYEPHLLEDYDLFCLNTSFRSGMERSDEICSHLWKFTKDNITGTTGNALEGLTLQGVNVQDFVRVTDGNGAVFYRQAVGVVKQKTGISLAEEWILDDALQAEMSENSSRFQEDCADFEGSVVNYENEDDEAVEAEAFEWDGIWNHFALSQAVKSTAALSEKSITLSNVPSGRDLSVGVGSADGSEDGVLEKQLFISYLCDYMTNAQEALPAEESGSAYLDYQMEYILCGQASDQQNLEQTLRMLLLMREGVNYAFLLSHPTYSEKAETLAYLLAGITLNEALIQSVKQLILLGWAYGESLVEVRQLLQGYELAVVKEEADWQLPLGGVLGLIGNPGRYDAQSPAQEGISYETCLRIFLTTKSAQTLAMRSLDVIEGELQLEEGCEQIHLDHCIEGLTAQVWMNDIYMERTYQYE
ncbi:MAG: DUF5702 domain-containing protein [Lachnospiraceae bacterium]|nr:DUF5702 domain-containing protein [Lachnospiraceae bacterium]